MVQVTVLQIWSHFLKTFNTFIMSVFCDKVVCVPLIHPRKMRALQIIGTEDWQDIYM